MTDSTLSLAARLAAHLIVDAIELAKPGARLAAKVGDRALSSIGRNPFNEAEAQRFLTMGGADRLAEAEAERDVYEPDPLWQAENRRQEFNTLPEWQAHTSAPGRPKPPVDAESPEVADPPSEATSGPPIWKSVHSLYVNCSYPMRPNAIACSDMCQASASTAVQPVDNKSIYLYRCAHHRGMVDGDTPGLIFDSVPTKTPDSHEEQPASVGVTGPGAGEVAPGRAEHPLYRQIQEQADAAVVAEVLKEHSYLSNVFCCQCNFHPQSRPRVTGPHMNLNDWVRHVSPLVTSALQQ